MGMKDHLSSGEMEMLRGISLITLTDCINTSFGNSGEVESDNFFIFFERK